MSKKALVLCGGGARGGYHIGVWRALKEVGYIPNIITGTSVGALNGALFTIGEDDLANEIWENMSMDTVFEPKDDKDINSINSVTDFAMTLGKIGGIDAKPLKELVKKLASEEKFRKSKIEFGLVTTRMKPIKKIEKFVDEMEEGHITDYIIASASCFPIMRKYTIEGVDYMDGGYSDNIPFSMAMNRGATDLVIVNMPSMFKFEKIDNINANIRYIFPKHDLGNFMLFNKETSRRNIELGYLDTMKVFNKYEGNKYTFEKGTTLESLGFDDECLKIYRKVFTRLPSAGKLESLAYNQFQKYVSECNENLFETKSDVIDMAEIAAVIYGIDPIKIYNFEEFRDAIKTKFNENQKKEEYKKIMSFDVIKNNITSLTELRKIVSAYDIKNVIAYMVSILIKNEITMIEKNEILAISTIMPEALASSIFISGCMEDK